MGRWFTSFRCDIRLYNLNLALVRSDRAQLGWRLHALMPRMLPGPLEQTGQKGAAGAVEMRMRAPIHPP
jgi:hypothetical protein